ncbi:cyclase family protein [Nesterenkonia natronophila]|uniref:Cyclase family protein n=1 Tax=Nesterenkonia natronophila TaxID=2174932 RepID=A0A3A4F2F2_9MICC|nr:cyclase family protein [Nesterenkonia natronophila]RJN32472.1 cyclase family protein [Nesterenkonia natronophila]
MSGWIDLSHEIRSGMTVFPGDPGVRIEPAATVAAHGFEVHSLHMGTHSGTHVDSPSHIIGEGRTIESIDLNELMGEAVVLHAGSVPPGTPIGLTHVGHQLEGGLAGARIVLIATGWDRYWGAEEYLDHPFLEPMLATRLLNLGARVIGVDTLSPDSTRDAENGLPVHRTVLGDGGLIIENLRKLDQLPSRVRFIGLPLRLTGMDGSPIRAVAEPICSAGE